MKNIFKYLMLLGFAGLCAVACKIAPMDDSHVEEAADIIANPIPALTITVQVTADDAATIKVTSDNPAAYISVLVDEYDEDQTELIDPAKLYAGGYESTAQKLEKYSSDPEKPFTLEVKDLSPNTIYQVYAIAANPKGQLGEIVNAHFLTTDGEVPVADFEGFASKGNQVALEFSEAVAYDEAKPAVATYYALYKGAIGEANVAVKVSGAVAVFTVTLDGENPLPNGACYTISYPAGAFADAVGNPCAAHTSNPGVTSAGEWAPSGLGGRIPVAPFDLVDEDKENTVSKMADATYYFSAPDGCTIAGNAKSAAASMTVTRTANSRTYETVYELAYGTDWGLASATSIILMKPADIDLAPGDHLSLNIAAGSFFDIYGNSSAAASHDYLVSYGYTLADVCGTYQVSGVSYFGAKYDEADWTFTIEESDNPEKGDIMLTSFYGFNLPNPSYGLFDGDTGVVTFAPFFYLGGFVYPDFEYATGKTADCWLDFVGLTYDYLKYWFSGGSQGSNAPVTLNMPASGTLDGISDVWGYEYDAYILPDSGDPADIAEDAESASYDYNFFEITPVSKVVVAPDPVSMRPGIIKACKAAPAKNFVTRAPEAKRIRK